MVVYKEYLEVFETEKSCRYCWLVVPRLEVGVAVVL